MEGMKWTLRVWSARAVFLLLLVPMSNRRKTAIAWGTVQKSLRRTSTHRRNNDVVGGMRARIETLAGYGSRFERLLEQRGHAATSLRSLPGALERYLHNAVCVGTDSRALSGQGKELLAGLRALQCELPVGEHDSFRGFLDAVREWLDVADWVLISTTLFVVGFGMQRSSGPL
ncbi:hypothetical protein FJY94_04350 [Candidatus Kaiserbacteria bacterium]|nr:hypothetical protein [Candidatus Kaiserbacteria bacterium]